MSFVWLPAANTNDVWLIDSLVVQETPATVMPSATHTPTETPTATNTPEPTATELVTVPVETTAEATANIGP